MARKKTVRRKQKKARGPRSLSKFESTDPKKHIRVVVSGERTKGRLSASFQKRLEKIKEAYPDLGQMLVDFCDVSYHDPCDTCDVA